jgi:hypothetical protein
MVGCEEAKAEVARAARAEMVKKVDFIFERGGGLKRVWWLNECKGAEAEAGREGERESVYTKRRRREKEDSKDNRCEMALLPVCCFVVFELLVD